MNYLNIRDTCHILCRYQYNKFAPVSTLERLVYTDASLVKVITKQLDVPVYWFLVVSLLLYEDATLWCGCPIVILSSLSSFLNVLIFILLGGDKGIIKLSSPSFVTVVEELLKQRYFVINVALFYRRIGLLSRGKGKITSKSP